MNSYNIWNVIIVITTMFTIVECVTMTETLPTQTETESETQPTKTNTGSNSDSLSESSSLSKSTSVSTTGTESISESSSSTVSQSESESLTSSDSKTETFSLTSTDSETIPTATVTATSSITSSESSTRSIAVLLGVMTVSEPIGNIFINDQNDPELYVNIHLSISNTEYDYSGIVITPTCARGLFYPPSIQIIPPTVPSDIYFKLRGTEIGTSSIHWGVTPVNETLNDGSATRFKRITSTPVAVRGLFSWRYESEAFYAFQKGEYIGIQSPPFPLTLTEEPLVNITLFIEKVDGLKFVPERMTLQGGELSMEISVMCSVPGTFQISVILEPDINGDSITLYQLPPTWNHSCLPTIETTMRYDGLPPFEDNDSDDLIIIPGIHRDHQNYDYRLSCASYPTGLVFSPTNFTITSQSGGRITCSGPAGVYNITCWGVDWILDGVHYGKDKLAFHNPEPISGFEILEKNIIETPYVPTLRMLSNIKSVSFTDGGAFSPGLSLILSEAPRSRLEVTVTDSLGILETNPPVLIFTQHRSRVDFRIRAHRETSSGQTTSLKYNLGSDNINDYVKPGDVAVQVSGPSEECARQSDSDSCYGLWEYELCWWNTATSSCQNTLIPIVLSPQPPPSQYHLQSVPFQASLTSPTVSDVRLSFTSPDQGLAFQDRSVLWSGDGSNTTQDITDLTRYYSITGTMSTLNNEPTETFTIVYYLSGSDFHHYARPADDEIIITKLIELIPPTTQQYPFLYVNTVSDVLTIKLQRAPPSGTLVLTPTCLNSNCGLQFSPRQIVFSAGITTGTFTVHTSDTVGEYWVTMIKSGAAASLYEDNNLRNSLIKVFPTIEVHTTPLPTLGDEEWSSEMFVQLLTPPIRTIQVSITAVDDQDFSTRLDSSLVQLIIGDIPGIDVQGESSIVLEFSPKHRTLPFRFRGMTPGKYGLLFTIEAGRDSQNFILSDDKRMRSFNVAPPKAWEFTRGQFGVDPECRVAVGRLDSNSLSITSSSKETCSISDIIDPSQLCHQTSKKSCENELRNNGRPCIWTPSTSTCKFGLPSGRITHYAVGEVHSLFRMFDGSLWSAGENEFGQLGHSCHGAAGCRDSIEYHEVLFENRTDAGKCREWETSQQDNCKLIRSSQLRRDNGDLEYVVSVVAGSAHTLVKMSSGIVYAWGSNNFGQLGVETLQQMISIPTKVTIPERSMERITCIAGGAYHSVAISDYGKVYVWGWNYFGQIAHEQSYRNSLNEPIMIHELVPEWSTDKPISLSAGDYHTVIGTKSGKVYTWGRNNYGQLAREGFDDLKPTLVELFPPAVFHGGMCDASQKIPPSWPPGTDFTLGLKDYSIYERS